MKANFKQYAPADFFHCTNLSESSGSIDPPEIFSTGLCPSGNAFLDAFVKNLHQYGMRNGDFHASLLGIKRTDMCTTVFTLTGMTYTVFVEEYLLLMATDLLKTGKKDLNALSKRLGFGSYSGFYRFMIRKGMGMPSRR